MGFVSDVPAFAPPKPHPTKGGKPEPKQQDRAGRNGANPKGRFDRFPFIRTYGESPLLHGASGTMHNQKTPQGCCGVGEVFL